MSMLATGAAKRLDIGKVLQDGLDALARNIAPFGLMALLLQGLPSLVAGIGQSLAPKIPALAILTVLGGVAAAVCGTILQAAVMYGTMRALDGHPAPMADCLRVGLKRWLALFGLSLLSGLGIVLGTALLIVPGVLLALRWSVAGPVIVMEGGRGVQDAMGRSAKLTEGGRWSIFLLLLIYMVILILFEAVVFAAAGGVMAVSTKPFVLLFISPLVNICSTLLFTTVGASLFRQLRGDKEGGSAEVLGEVFA